VSSRYLTPAGKVPLDYLLWLREISNSAFAEQAGVERRLVSDYRRGKKPPPEHRKLISEVLGVSEADLGWVVEGVNA
jgi:transcriptional regulator with XRE-family HTH domain